MLLQHGTAFLGKTSLYGAESRIDSTSHTHTVGRKVSDNCEGRFISVNEELLLLLFEFGERHWASLESEGIAH